MLWQSLDFLGYPKYKVSKWGAVLGPLKMLKPQINNKGYQYVKLCRPGDKPKIFSLHRLVALAFVPNPDSKPHVNHYDGNRLNNWYYNLEWVTHQENIQHAFDAGLIKTRRGSTK